jgi:uncharacterized protein YbjQ (UPF0145 family)
MNQTANCESCQKPKANLQCGVCKCIICKNCAVFLEEGHFSFMGQVPAELKHTTFCNGCYDSKIVPAMEKYDQLMLLAKDIKIFDKTQGKESRLLKRNLKPLKVENCPDREETLLRLGFLAVEVNCNAVVDVELKSKTVRDGAYQTSIWSGTGVPTNTTRR